MRMRAVELLYETFRVFYSHDLHHILLACDLYNRLLYFFGKYPFHNILHQKVSDIFIYLLDKASDSEEIINSVLYETNLVKKILETYRESSTYKMENSNQTITSGYMPFIRKLSNKLVAISKKQDEVANFLDSIPEWTDFVTSHLDKRNELEAKQLGNKKQPLTSLDEDSDDNGNSLNNLLFKISSIGAKQEENDSDSSDDEDSAQMFESTTKGPLMLNKDESSSEEEEEIQDQLVANYSSNYSPAAPVVQIYQQD